MAWFIILVVWVTMTILAGYPYIEKIEKLRSSRDRFFPILRLRSAVVVGLVEKVLEKTGIIEDEELS